MAKNYWWMLGSCSGALFVLATFTGCLYSTQHFNNGRLLEPGRSSFSLAGGVSHHPTLECPDGSGQGDTKNGLVAPCYRSRGTFDPLTGNNNSYSDSTPALKAWATIPKIGLDYRLGVSRKWGPFTGTEIGLHLEGLTNPISAEFDLKLGLPIPTKLSMQHAFSAGWIIGAWADNSYFMEYAISRTWKENCLFGNYRLTRLATQPADLQSSVEVFQFEHKRRWIHQASIGITWTLPKLLIVPDFIIPQVILTYPLAPLGEDKVPEYILDEHALDFNLGMGWNFK